MTENASASTHFRPLEGNPTVTRFVRIVLEEWDDSGKLREIQDIRLRDGVVVLAGGPGDPYNATAFYLKDGLVK